MAQNETRKVLIEDSADQATNVAAELFRCIVCETVGQRDICRVALAGGTTPHSLYQRLADSAALGDVPWYGVEIFFGDERDVPHDHVESNYRMAQRTLLDHVPIVPQNIHPMPADADDLDAAAERYEQEIRQVVPAESARGIPRFDLMLLGMGGDGHTASLFPGTEALNERKKLVMAYFVPVLGRRRMTFTFPLINASSNVILLVTGADKAQAVSHLLSDTPEATDLPAGRVNPHDGKLYIVLDSAAARHVSFPSTY